MKPYLIGLFIGILLTCGIWYYIDRDKVPSPDYEAENKALRGQIDEAHGETKIALDSLNLERQTENIKDSLLRVARQDNKSKNKHEKAIINTMSANAQDSLLTNMLRQYTETHSN